MTAIDQLEALLAAAEAAGKACDMAPKEGEIRQQAVSIYHRAALDLQHAAVNRLPALLVCARALKPFAKCCEQIAPDEDDDEWAKFRLEIKDYRAADGALKMLESGG